MKALVTGTAGSGKTIFAIGTPNYMPGVMTRATDDFGLFGVTITLLGWLLAAAGIVVASNKRRRSISNKNEVADKVRGFLGSLSVDPGIAGLPAGEPRVHREPVAARRLQADDHVARRERA